MNQDLDRLPPQNLDAEKSVIGSLLLDPSLCDDVLPILKTDDFYGDSTGRLFSRMVSMHNEGRKIDVTLLIDRLKAADELDKVGDMAFIGECMQAVAVSSHAVYYAKIVAEQARRRQIIHAAAEMLRTAYDRTKPIDEIVTDCESFLQKIPTGEYDGDPAPFSQALIDACILVDEIASHKRAAGVMTGLDNFDMTAGGLFPGELTILAARPSIGKTAMGLQIAQHVAGKNAMVYFASLEMGKTELALRILCGWSCVPMSRVRNGSIGQDDLTDLTNASLDLSPLPIVLHDRAGLTTADIRRACRRLKAKCNLGLIVVDYLQRITPADRRVDRHLQIGQITWELKAMAIELKTPVLCMCQLGRAAETVDAKTGKVIEPRLSHLKESGDIEQDADMVLLLHRQQRASETTLILAKNRQGEQAKFELTWEAPRTRFSCNTGFSEFEGYAG